MAFKMKEPGKFHATLVCTILNKGKTILNKMIMWKLKNNLFWLINSQNQLMETNFGGTLKNFILSE